MDFMNGLAPKLPSVFKDVIRQKHYEKFRNNLRDNERTIRTYLFSLKMFKKFINEELGMDKDLYQVTARNVYDY